MAADVSFSEVLRLDAELVRLGRGVAALRLGVGTALEALSASGGHHELGFSSLEAYARERCERTGRWAADTRALARRVGGAAKSRSWPARGRDRLEYGRAPGAPRNARDGARMARTSAPRDRARAARLASRK